MKKGIMVAVAFILVLIGVSAEPVVDSITGEIEHGGTLTITGSEFGIKDSAPPLMWDDCEGATTDSDDAVVGSGDTATAFKNGVVSGWDEAWPRVGDSSPTENARIRYRNEGFRSVDGPHGRSETYLAGSHHQEDPWNEENTDAATLAGYPGYNERTCPSGHMRGQGGCTDDDALESSYRNVCVTADSGADDKPIWYISFYHRLDPDWETTNLDRLNHKFVVINDGQYAYSHQAGLYTSWEGSVDHAPEHSDSADVRITNGNDGSCGNLNPWDPGNGNPRMGWQKFELIYKMGGTGSDDRDIWANNIKIRDGDCPEGWTDPKRSFSIGGYWRRNVDRDPNDNQFYRGNVNNFRYFDDMFIDTSLSRVILADDETYEDATIVEPQIPTDWGTGSIDVQVNLGALDENEPIYLFVFDSDNEHNAQGFDISPSNIHYMSTNPSDDCANLQECFALMSGGDTLIIRDGIYTGTENMISNSNHPPRGISRDQPTVIRAENIGKVFFDGEFSREMFEIAGTSGGRDWLQYWTFQGIQWIRSDGYGIHITNEIDQDTDLTSITPSYLSFKNCGFYGTQNSVRVSNTNYLLFEDCWTCNVY